jgi:hypothetical protein
MRSWISSNKLVDRDRYGLDGAKCHWIGDFLRDGTEILTTKNQSWGNVSESALSPKIWKERGRG